MRLRNSLPFLLLLTACGGHSSETETAGSAVREGVPPALRGAKLAFQREDGVYVQPVGGAAARVAENATWPRWSPDGRRLALVRNGGVEVLDPASGDSRVVASPDAPHAAAWRPDGSEVWFTDGDRVKAVHLETGATRVLAEGPRFLELDAGPDGRRGVATVKRLGYHIRIFEADTGKARNLARGCSASFSPDGTRVTNNVDGHTRLELLDPADGRAVRALPAPPGAKTDNQFWSNHPDWIVSMRESDGAILAHRVGDAAVWRISRPDGCDRPDLYVP